jgi:hypothetical protein
MNPQPDFRITPPDWPKEMPALQRLAAAEAAVVREFEQKAASTFCEIAIHAWRMQRRMTDRTTKEVKEEHKAMHRSVAGILEALTNMGFTLRDREGEFYDYGLPEKVVAAEKRAGISREMVVETIRPSIMYGDQLVKPGEIVIAVPEEVAVTALRDEQAAAPTPTAAE